jgi:hypothetical protein
VPIPAARQLAITRRAISPRFATSRQLITAGVTS